MILGCPFESRQNFRFKILELPGTVCSDHHWKSAGEQCLWGFGLVQAQESTEKIFGLMQYGSGRTCTRTSSSSNVGIAGQS